MMKHLLTTAAVTLAVTNAGLAQQATQPVPVPDPGATGPGPAAGPATG